MMIDSDRDRIIAELRIAATQLRDAFLALNAAIGEFTDDDDTNGPVTPKPTAPRN